MSFQRHLVSLIGVFERVFGKFVSGLVVFFAVVRGGNPVSLRGQFV
jgi:hypothetical protein